MDLENQQAEVEERVPNKKKVTPRASFSSFILGIVIVIIIAIAGSYFLATKAVKSGSEESLAIKLANIYNLSAAKVNGEKIPFNLYMEDITTLRKFYENPPEGFPPATDEQIKEQVISRLIANSVLAGVAKDYGVTVTDEEVQELEDELLQQFASKEEAEKELQDKYGWDLEKYAEKILKPLKLEQNLYQAFVSSTDELPAEFMDEQIRARHILFQFSEDKDDETVIAEAQAVLDRIKAGEDFATLAGEFGSDGTKASGGDLGWFGKGMMVPDFENAVFALEPGQLGEELVKTQFGYHIIKVEEKKQVRNFNKFMDDKLKKADIKIYIDVENPFAKLGEEDTEE